MAQNKQLNIKKTRDTGMMEARNAFSSPRPKNSLRSFNQRWCWPSFPLCERGWGERRPVLSSLAGLIAGTLGSLPKTISQARIACFPCRAVHPECTESRMAATKRRMLQCFHGSNPATRLSTPVNPGGHQRKLLERNAPWWWQVVCRCIFAGWLALTFYLDVVGRRPDEQRGRYK